MNLAEWLARQADAVGTADACRAAARLDPEQGRSIAGWLESRGWDEQSHRTLLHAVADIWREHSRSTLEQALNTYRLVLNFNFEAEAPYVLQALEHFPRDYVPAWQFKLDIYVQLGPTFYSNAFATMRDALSVFDAQQTEWLLTVCDRMDASIPDVHLVRAEIHEAAEQLPLAAEALLGLQAVRPDVLPLVERSFADIIQRHPDEHYLRASLGDAYRNAEKWDAALEEYQQAQHADDELAAQLVDRYRDILSRVPESIEARWSLARAHRTLKQPEQASQYLDEITDRNGAQSAEAEPFLKALTKSHPTCGYVWYVRGKLAFRAGDLSVAIAHLKRAVKEGHIPQAPLILLHEMLGRAYQATDALDQAVMNLRRAVALSPDDPALRRALLGVRLTQIDRLIAEKEREIETSKDKVRVQIELADLLQQRGDYPRAVRVLQSALTQTDQRCRIHLALARCFARQGLHHLAAASLEAAASGDELTDEERKETLYRLAQTRWRQLRYEEAIQALEQICALDVTYQNVLGLIDMIQRDKVTAQHQAVTLRIASRVNPFAEGR
jgi:tetratricopeptide (TPR) repeat protein